MLVCRPLLHLPFAELSEQLAGVLRSSLLPELVSIVAGYLYEPVVVLAGGVNSYLQPLLDVTTFAARQETCMKVGELKVARDDACAACVTLLLPAMEHSPAAAAAATTSSSVDSSSFSSNSNATAASRRRRTCILFIGGLSLGLTLRLTDVFDVEQRQWTPGPSLLTARLQAAAVVVHTPPPPEQQHLTLGTDHVYCLGECSP
jgi:hypothetical protein